MRSDSSFPEPVQWNGDDDRPMRRSYGRGGGLNAKYIKAFNEYQQRKKAEALDDDRDCGTTRDA